MRLTRTRLVVSFLLAGSAPALAQDRRLTPADIFALEYAVDPQVSRDGQWVAYVRQWSDPMSDRRYSNLWLVKSDGSGHRPLTSGKYTDASPRWSPDGKRLLYASNKSGMTQLYVRWMDTGEAQQLTNVPNAPQAARWSPDGSQVAFLQLVSRPALVVGTPLTPPPGATWAAPPKYTDALVFRQDGAGEVPTGFLHAFVVRADGGAPRQVTSGDFHHGGNPWGGGSLAWSSDGSELILPARRGERPEWNSRETELWAVGVKDGAMRQLTDRFGPDQSPVVSPDGRQIAWVGFDDRKQGFQNTLLYVMNRDGSGKRRLGQTRPECVVARVGERWTRDLRAVRREGQHQGWPHRPRRNPQGRCVQPRKRLVGL
jgi:acylaminoacyl-peptidase